MREPDSCFRAIVLFVKGCGECHLEVEPSKDWFYPTEGFVRISVYCVESLESTEPQRGELVSRPDNDTA